MNYRIYIFPAVISAILIFSAFFRLGPLLESAMQHDQAISAKFEALPERVASGEITANAAVNYASVAVPKYAGGTGKIIHHMHILLLAQATLLSICLFFAAYLAQKWSGQAHNNSFKRTPDGAA